MKWVYLGLGSNLGDSVALLGDALNSIKQFPMTRLMKTSSFYRTSPVGPINQHDFINAVCLCETALSAVDLLNEIQKMEKALGRVRDERWGPRLIDCDILWMQGTELFSNQLTIPHPEMQNRLFVLVPLQEIWDAANSDALFDAKKLATRIEQLKVLYPEDNIEKMVERMVSET